MTRQIGTNMVFISVGVLARSPNRHPIGKALRDDAQVTRHPKAYLIHI